MNGTIYQKERKNRNRIKAKDRPYHSSMQRNYGRKLENPKQIKLI